MSRRAAAVVLGSCSWSQSGKDGLLTAADSSALRHWSDGRELHVRTFRHQYRSVQRTVRTKMSNCPAPRSELSRHMDLSFAHCGKSAKRRLRSPAGTRAEINFMRCAPHEINFWPCTVQRGSVVADVETDRFGRACLRSADVVMQETIRLARRVTSPFRPHARRTVFQHHGGTLQQWPRHGRMHYLAAL